MSQIRETALSAERIRRGAWWCLAVALASSLAIILPWLGLRELGILLGLAMIVGVASDVTIRRDLAMGIFLSNAAVVLACAAFALLARLLIALFA
ncbi:MAG: hypothetical protein U0232_06720 [Thermomicrobiales bacterium]